nr:hypothetical protein [Bacteroidota bacterium]
MKNIAKMEAYKFATTVLENGIIKIPELENYTNQRIEVIVVLKPEKKVQTKRNSMNDFLSSWAGYFSTVETDDVRYNYLMEKYK